MWDAFDEIAGREGKTTAELCTVIASRKIGANLTAAVRLFIIVYFRVAAQHNAKQFPSLHVVGSSADLSSHSPHMVQALLALGR